MEQQLQSLYDDSRAKNGFWKCLIDFIINNRKGIPSDTTHGILLDGLIKQASTYPDYKSKVSKRSTNNLPDQESSPKKRRKSKKLTEKNRTKTAADVHWSAASKTAGNSSICFFHT